MIFSIIDVETTGYPKNKITDISIYTTDGKSIIKEFHSLVNPFNHHSKKHNQINWNF